jgi:hypothetical protein
MLDGNYLLADGRSKHISLYNVHEQILVKRNVRIAAVKDRRLKTRMKKRFVCPVREKAIIAVDI